MDVWHQITLPCFTSKIFHVFPDVKEPNIKIRGIIGQASGLLGFQVCWTRVSPKFDQGLSLTCSVVSMVSSLIHPKVGSWFSRTCIVLSPGGWCYRKPIVFPGFFPLSGGSIDISRICGPQCCEAQSVIAGEYIAHYCPPQARSWESPSGGDFWNDCSIMLYPLSKVLNYINHRVPQNLHRIQLRSPSSLPPWHSVKTSRFWRAPADLGGWKKKTIPWIGRIPYPLNPRPFLSWFVLTSVDPQLTGCAEPAGAARGPLAARMLTWWDIPKLWHGWWLSPSYPQVEQKRHFFGGKGWL